MKLTRFKKPKPAKADTSPTFAEVKLVMASVLPNALALMVVVSFASHKKENAQFRAALTECGYTDPVSLLSDIDLLLPFMAATVSDTMKFRMRVMEEMKNV